MLNNSKTSKRNSELVIPFSVFRVYAISLFLFIFTYLLFRALFNEPLHDEIATFFNYIETGKIFGKNVIQDAQNQLLNSYCSRIMYLLFGENIFVLRIPNLLAFTIYFYGIYRISQLLKETTYQILLLTSLSTISFIIEYFAYSRGYGMGMAFFIWMLIYSIEWLNKSKLKNAFYLYFFAYMAIFSNLIFFGSSFLAMFLIGVIHLKKIRLFNLKKNVLLMGLHFCFLLSIFPFIWLSYLLKNGGALYHGDLSGLWKVTGKTLTITTLFYNEDWLKYVIFFILFSGCIFLLYSVVKKGFWDQIKEKESVIGYYLIGNLVIILMLAHILKVNYPEDRVGMYLIILFILFFTFIIIQIKKIKVFLLILLFFPISFVWKMNLHSSIYSIDNRIKTSFYHQVRAHTSTETSIGVDPIMPLTWAFHERIQSNTKANVDYLVRKFDPSYDILILKIGNITKKDNLSNYSIIAVDTVNQIIAYKRKEKIRKKSIIEKSLPPFYSTKKQIEILTFDNVQQLKKKKILVNITGEIKVNKTFDNLRLDIDIINDKNEITHYQSLNQRWLLGIGKTRFSLNINTVLDLIKEKDKKLIVNIWNPQGRIITFKNGFIKLYEIKP